MLRSRAVDGLAHITGGGLTENIVRILPQGLGIAIDKCAWEMPEVFSWLQENGAIEDSEMLRTFNCGVGMVMIVPEPDADRVRSQAQSMDLDCFDIGSVVTAGADSRVDYIS